MKQGLYLGYVLLGYIFFNAKVVECITCLNCQNIADLSQCKDVLVCKDDETCYIDKVLSPSTFQPLYNTGCKKMEYCKLEFCNKKAYGDGNSRKKKATDGEDLTLCSHCCYEDSCNAEGCGYKHPQNNNTKCFSCKEVYDGGPPCIDTEDCDLKLFACSVTNHLGSNHPGAYELGCKFKRKQCDLYVGLTADQKDKNVKCCDTTLCNASPYNRKVNKTAIAIDFECPTGIARPTTTPAPSTDPPTTTTTTRPPLPVSTPDPPTTTTTTRPPIPVSTPAPFPTKPSTLTPPNPPTKTSTPPHPPTKPSKNTTTIGLPTKPPTKPTTAIPTFTPQPPSSSVATIFSSTTQNIPVPATTIKTTNTPAKPNVTTTQIPTVTTAQVKNATTTVKNIKTTPVTNATTTQATSASVQPTNATSANVTKSTTPSPTSVQVTNATTVLLTTQSTTKLTTTQPTTKATTPSTTLAASTGPPPKTLPPITTSCAKCAGPGFLCEKLFAPTPCPPPNNYCINTITNHKDGTKTVDRACGNFDTCYREWFLGSSDNDKCRKFKGNDEQRLDFQCTFCCVKDNCNIPLHPADDTLYKPV